MLIMVGVSMIQTHRIHTVWNTGLAPVMITLITFTSALITTIQVAVFVGVVGLNAGKDALTTIQEHGVTLLYLGVGATLIPQIITFFFSYYVLKIKNPVISMAVVAGSRSGNPAFAALLEKTQNATPVAAFTVTYAVANILLTLWGPVIVAVMQ
jgi:uncharacterized transporter YbjL